MMIWVIFLFYFSLIDCNNQFHHSNQNDDELIFSQILFRHGDRTIRKTYKTDPYKGKEHWPEGFGQLVNIGKRRAYSLGLFLRHRYTNFFKNGYHPNQITIRSSDYDRTINSANLVLASFFPPKGYQVWNYSMPWQPIAVHSIPLSMDYLINADHACKRWIEAREEYLQSPEILKIMDDNKELFQYIEKQVGEPVRTMEFIKDIYEALEIEEHLNKTVPDWAHKLLTPGGALEKFPQYWMELNTGTTEMKRLKSGFLLKDILDRFKNKAQSPNSDELMVINSGHDMTIASLLHTMGLFWRHVPPYSSCLLFEMYKPKNSGNTLDDYYIQLYYRNSTAEHLSPMEIPGCGTKCKINQLYDVYSKVLPSGYDECKPHSDREFLINID